VVVVIYLQRVPPPHRPVPDIQVFGHVHRMGVVAFIQHVTIIVRVHVQVVHVIRLLNHFRPIHAPVNIPINLVMVLGPLVR
jgi:hypothetical protein